MNASGKSNLALIASAVALAWNVYRDLILTPRFRVRLRIAERPSTWTPEERPRPWWSLNSKGAWVPYLELNVVNFGPGLLVVRAAVIRIRPVFWSWLENQISVESLLAENLGEELEKGQKVIY
jgi:hypothetical protein